ncbi:TonB-dependent receptor [Rudaea sp.]|uniref:TonB-dependent receptor n=1 Tax=Rudaea sp. TaxID=2136325 RepID=UPI0032202FED
MPFDTRRCSLAAAVALALAFSPAALRARADNAQAPRAAEPAAAPSVAAASPELEKITVTAQSRTQELQQVPISLAVVSNKDIENRAATDLSDLSAFLPGVSINSWDRTQPDFSLRGISTGGFSLGIDQAVGVYINGVYQTRGGGALLAFNDVQRVEVLKGPQGTLFGRNTAAGAISIVTNEPAADYAMAQASVRFGNYGRRDETALVNVPLAGDFALRASFVNNRNDGWLEDAATQRRYNLDRQWGGRIAIGGSFAEDWKMQLTYDHESLREPPRMQIGLQPFLDNTSNLAPFPEQRSSYVDPRKTKVYVDAEDARQTRSYDGLTLALTRTFGWGTLTSTTAASRDKLAHFEDQDGTNDPVVRLDSGVNQTGRTLYQELKLAGANDRFDWVGGASFYRETGTQSNVVVTTTTVVDTLFYNQGIRGPDGSPVLGFFDRTLASHGFQIPLTGKRYQEQVDDSMASRSYAAFGDLIWHVNDRLNLTGGLRFTHDEKTFDWFNPLRQSPGLDSALASLGALQLLSQIPPQLLAVLTHNIVFGDAVGVPVRREASWQDVSPRVVADYHFTPETMAYASASHGYKAGGMDGVQIDSQYAPEKVWNYEAGIKQTFPDLHMLLNGAVFYYDYSNRQSLTLVPGSGQAGIPQYVVTSSDQSARGLEAEWVWKPLANLALNASAQWIDAVYASGTRALTGADLSDQPVGEPRLSFSAGGTYTWRTADHGMLEFNLQQAYRGKTRCNNDSTYQGTCATYATFAVGSAQQRTDLRLGWTSADSRFGAALFVNNLFDKQYVASVGGQGRTVLGVGYGVITPPRFYGAEFRVKFD